MPPTARRSVAFFCKKFGRVQNIMYICNELSIFFSFFDAIFVVTIPDFPKNRGFFMFHVKFLHKNFVSREKVIIFAATSAKGQSKNTKSVI